MEIWPSFLPDMSRFPSDSQTYAIDKQFLLGPALLITPVLTQVCARDQLKCSWFSSSFFWIGQIHPHLKQLIMYLEGKHPHNSIIKHVIWFIYFKGSTSVTGYFPDATWYDGTDGSILQGGKTHTLSAPWDKINFHLRGGYVIPTQMPNITTYYR